MEKSDDTMSETVGELAKALACAQGEFDQITADRTGQTGHRKYKYADLNSFLLAVRSALSKHELAIIQKPSSTPDMMVHVETMLIHGSGEWVSSFLSIKAANDTAQGIGSAITYARRYALGAMLGLAPEEDDDGKAASTPQGPQQQSKPGVRISTKEPGCDEIARARIIQACKDLEWKMPKLVEVISKAGAKKLADLTKSQATSLAETLEKKFRELQAKETFSPGSDGQT